MSEEEIKELFEKIDQRLLLHNILEVPVNGDFDTLIKLSVVYKELQKKKQQLEEQVNLYKSAINELSQYCLGEQIPEEYLEYNEFVEVQNMAYDDIYNKIEEILVKANIKKINNN